MRKIIPISVIILSLVGLIMLLAYRTHAQAATNMPLQLTVVGAHTLCSVSAATTNYCFATDGIWQSINGAPYALVGIVGPAGPQGATGTQGPPGPPGPIAVSGVASVNGKTGVVVLAIQ